MGRRILAVHVLGVFGVLALAGAGCDDLTVHSFVGQHYDKTNDCLEAKSLIDVVEGKAHGTCTGVRCFVFQVKDAKGGASDGDAYVSTACEPAPDFRDATEDPDGSVCALALTAYARMKDGACKTNV